MLRTETNTTQVEAEVRRAARAQLHRPAKDLQTDLEHGQWWVTHRPTGAQWSVVDTDKGFDFEQVTYGDD